MRTIHVLSIVEYEEKLLNIFEKWRNVVMQITNLHGALMEARWMNNVKLLDVIQYNHKIEIKFEFGQGPMILSELCPLNLENYFFKNTVHVFNDINIYYKSVTQKLSASNKHFLHPPPPPFSIVFYNQKLSYIISKD